MDSAKEELRRDIDAVKNLLGMRLDGMDRALVLFNEGITRVPSHVDTQILHLKELHEKWITERFTSMTQQLGNVYSRLTQMEEVSKEALGTALAAAKELVALQNAASTTAIAKSEMGTDKRLDQIVTLLQTTTGALESKITILNDQSKNSMTRQEVLQLFATVSDKLDGPTGLAMRLENLVARTIGRDDQSRQTTSSTQWVIGALIGGVALLIALLTLVMKLQSG